MKSQTTGILVGGILPAFGYAAFAVGTKIASQNGLGAGPLLVLVGAGCLVVGAFFWRFLPAGMDAATAGWGLLAGVAWAAGTGLVSLALSRWGVPIAKLNPLYNTNTLLTVAVGLIVFGEWREVNPWQLSFGAVLILAGSLLVSAA
jgi:uncharacterized membrane protein